MEAPCRTIAVAALRVASGGTIVLNGNGTDQQPFGCKKLLTSHYRGIPQITRNVTIASLDFTRAHIRCLTGFCFNRSDQDLRVTLTGITFFETPLRFIDCSEITLINCTHQNATEAVIINTTASSIANVTIRGSLFQNNSRHCVKIQFSGGSEKVLKFSLDIKDTNFLNNGILDYFKREVLVLNSYISPKIDLSIAVEKVKVAHSGGPFLAINLPNASTSEKYVDVVLERNNFVISKRTPRSLYYSVAQKAKVTFHRLQCKDNDQVRCVTIFGRKNATLLVRVHESRFYNNSAYQSGNKTLFAAIFRVVGSESHSGTVIISNTSFVKNNQTALSITPNFYLALVNVTMSSSLNGLGVFSWDVNNKNNFHLNVTIEGCKFQNNTHDIYGLFNNTINIDFRVRNTLFDGKEVQRYENTSFGIRLIISRLERANVSQAAIEIEDVTFKSRPSNSFAFFSKGN